VADPEVTLTVSAADAGCASCTAIAADGLPATSDCGAVPKDRPGCGVQLTSLSSPALTNCTSATPPPVNPAPPQRDCASESEVAPASQVGCEAKAVVEPVMVCHWLAVE
jgi:hypothetical protein